MFTTWKTWIFQEIYFFTLENEGNFHGILSISREIFGILFLNLNSLKRLLFFKDYFLDHFFFLLIK